MDKIHTINVIEARRLTSQSSHGAWVRPPQGAASPPWTWISSQKREVSAKRTKCLSRSSLETISKKEINKNE